MGFNRNVLFTYFTIDIKLDYGRYLQYSMKYGI